MEKITAEVVVEDGQAGALSRRLMSFFFANDVQEKSLMIKVEKVK